MSPDAAARLFLADQTGVEVGVDGHLLAGHGIEGETSRHFATRPAPLVITTKLMIDQDHETRIPTVKLPPTRKCPKASITLPARHPDRYAPEHDDPGRCDVQRQAQQGGDQQHVGKTEKSSVFGY